MNNNVIESELNGCKDELDAIEHRILGLDTSRFCSYLLKYAVIRSCSCIEHAFKNLIADYYEAIAPSIANYIAKHVRDSSKNPSFKIIYEQLNEFEPIKAKAFLSSMDADTNRDRLKSSLSSLKNLRNSVAHGTDVTTTIGEVKSYFLDSIIILDYLDSVLT